MRPFPLSKHRTVSADTHPTEACLEAFVLLLHMPDVLFQNTTPAESRPFSREEANGTRPRRCQPSVPATFRLFSASQPDKFVSL